MGVLSPLKRISIILVTFESSKKIETALKSIPDNVKTILVDNASHDDSVTIAKITKNDIEIIALEQNIGFGRANNCALEKIVTDFVLLQNPDAILNEGVLEKAIDIFDKNPTLGALGLGHSKFNDETLVDTDVVSGAMFFRMAVLKQVGFFDENIFLYAEDTEICWRILKAGYRVCRYNKLDIFHQGGDSVGLNDINTMKNYVQGQSIAYFEQKKKGKLWGGLYMFFKAHRSLPFAFLSKNKYEAKKARRDGVMSYLKYGNKVMFDNPLAKRRKI